MKYISRRIKLVLIPIHSARIAFDPISHDLNHPADRRKFCYFANAINLKYEIYHPKKEYDLVIISETSDISYWSRKKKVPKIIFNLNDSYLAEGLTFRSSLRGLAKFISRQSKYLEIDFASTLKKMCRRADAVICSTPIQKKTIEEYCRNTHIMFDAHFSEINMQKKDYTAHKPFRLIWEGLPTNSYQLAYLSKLICQSNLKDYIDLNVITDKYTYKLMNRFLKVDTQEYLNRMEIKSHFHEWSIKNLQEVSINSDLAIIPIDINNPMMIGKPENKLLLFWRLGLPTLVSATPSYENAMKMSNQNYFIKDDSEWISLIKELMDSKEKRIEAGTKGFEYVTKNYNKNEFLKRWESIFKSVGYSIY